MYSKDEMSRIIGNYVIEDEDWKVLSMIFNDPQVIGERLSVGVMYGYSAGLAVGRQRERERRRSKAKK